MSEDWFRVEVNDKDGQVVAIETEMLCGRDIGEEERRVILKAIAHLSGFIGFKHRPPYPVGVVNGPCVCGSWPGGECLKCEWRPHPDEWTLAEYDRLLF